MAEAPNTTSTLTGLFKEAYGETVEKLIPEFAYLQRNIPFKKVSGNLYHQPVLLTQEAGVTYSAADNGAFALEESVAAVMGDAQVKPAQLVVKSQLSYEAAMRSAGGGAKAFLDATRMVVTNMIDTAAKREEIDIIYGCSAGGIGLVNAGTSSSAAFVISDATWAPGIWAGLEGAQIAILDTGLGTAEDATEFIASIALDTKTITVGNVLTSLDAGDVVVFKGSTVATPTYHSQFGLDYIITTSGTVFNIANSTYALWKGQTVSSVGQPTLAKIMNAVTKAVNRGCTEELVVLMSPRMYEVINTDLAGMRRFDSSYSRPKAEAGSENITLYGSTGAPIRLVPHLFVKEGDAYVLPIKRLMRIGSTELTFRRPVHGEIFAEVAGYAGFELRCYKGSQVFSERPSWMVKMTGITYA